MDINRGEIKQKYGLTSGPGKLSIAMGIDIGYNQAALSGSKIWIESGTKNDDSIVSTTRIGVDYADEDASLPWRFYLESNLWVSKK